MTIRDLIERLEDFADDFGDDIEVRLAQQPRWAFEYSIGNIAAVEDLQDSDPIIYIGEGQQLGYLPGDAARELGWSKER